MSRNRSNHKDKQTAQQEAALRMLTDKHQLDVGKPSMMHCCAYG